MQRTGFLSIVCLLIGAYFSNIGCRPNPDPYPYVDPNGTNLASAGSGVACIPSVADSGARLHTGNFDTKSCNTMGCHADFVGGWLYTDAKGEEWIPEATVTVTNEDGTVVTAVTASDGFFSLIGNSQMIGKIPASYKACVSKCPDTVCSTTPHTSADCQSSACHGGDSPRIYLTQNTGSASAGSGGAATCADLPSGGPKAHNVEYDDQECWICHDKGKYTGGFLYDGMTSNTPVARATVTLTPKSGAPLTAVTGPFGLFYFPGTIKAPYTACVKKCQDSICSADGTHTTPDDCRACHDETTRIHLP